jgi:anhydro-N-acetylmuramic acid kinase
LSKDPFLTAPYPKSIGKEYYSMAWLEHHLQGLNLNPQDVQATLCAYTVMVIAHQIELQLPLGRSVWICGGGAKNLEILKGLQNRLSQYQVRVTHDAGFSEDYLEAMMMAWLGWMRYTKQPINLYSIMGGKPEPQLVGLICE